MIRIVFVCLGNICRSPMAEGMFKFHVENSGLGQSFFIDSAGTADYHIGKQPDGRMCKTAKDRGILLEHSARQFKSNDLTEFDYVIPMDNQNFENIHKLKSALEASKAQVILMRDFDTIEKGSIVPDPYYGGDDGFVDVYEILNRSTKNLLDYLIEKHQLK
jgi:protein-tyrosine phosphatase